MPNVRKKPASKTMMNKHTININYKINSPGDIFGIRY